MVSIQVSSNEFVSIVGKDDVISDPALLRNYSRPVFKVDPKDYLYNVYVPMLVVKPETTEEVSKVVKLAHSKGLAVCVVSGGTDTAGGSATIDPSSVIVDMQKMNKVIELGKESLFVTTQSAIVLQDLDEQLFKNKLTHGHRPETYPIATVAGAIAHYGVGRESGAFGLLSDNVIGLTVVLANGDILNVRAVNKSSMGEKNLLWLFLGNQGRHGIITEVTLRLFPYFEENNRATIVGFPTFKETVKASFAISKEGFKPSVQHARSRRSLENTSLPSLANFKHLDGILMLSFDGPKAAIVEAQMKEVVDLCKKLGAEVMPESMAKEWTAHREIRDRGKGGADRIKKHLLERAYSKPLEWSVNTSFLREKDFLTFTDDAQAIAAKHGVAISSYSMEAYPMRMAFGMSASGIRDPAEAQKQLAACRFEILWRTLELGGSAASIHSSPFTYEAVAEAELTKTGLDVMKRIKRALDPDITFGRGQGKW